MPVRHKFLSFFILLALVGARPALAQWEAIGPYGGHAHRIVIDPVDSRHLYAATKNGHIYESTDAGNHWKALPFALDSSASLSSLVLNPKNSDELFVGVSRTYDTAAENLSGDAGIYWSSDGGVHWARLPQTNGWSVFALAVHPVNPRIVIAGTEEGVFRSEDRGLTWRQISPRNHPHIKSVVSLAIDRVNAGVIYAGTTHLPWKTSDGGRTWQSIHVGMADDSDVFSIAINSANPQSLLLGACSGVYRTDSAGARWVGKSGIPEQSARTHQVLQDPVNPGTFYAATAHGLWKSTDGGRIWKQPNPYPYIVNSIAIDPKNPRTVYLATDRSGLLKSADGGQTFKAINNGFVNRNLGRLVGDEVLHVASAYEGDFGGIFTTLNRGVTWALDANQDALHGRNIVALAVAPGNPAQLLAGTYDGLLRSMDRGKTWSLVNSFNKTEAGRGRIYDLAFSPSDSRTILVATDHGLFQSTDGAVSWQKNPAANLNTSIFKLALDPSDMRGMMLQTPGGVWISQDKGATWEALDFGHHTAIYDFAFSPGARNRILAASSRGLLSSRDGGKTWNTITGGLPEIRFDQVVVVPGLPQELYVLSRDGRQMWRTRDDGDEWSRLDDTGLEGAWLRFIGVGSGQPFVVTENHGVFRLNATEEVAHTFPQAP